MAGVVTLWGMTTGLQQVQHSQLAQQNKVDLTLVQDSIRKLQTQLDPTVMVLQNRVGSDLIMAEKGEICAMLGEECCFYINLSDI